MTERDRATSEGIPSGEQRGTPQRGQPTRQGGNPQWGQHDLFGGPPADVELVRAVVPSEEVVRVAQRLPKNLHFGTSSWSFPGWVGIVYAQL